jgi:hypothetical protein
MKTLDFVYYVNYGTLPMAQTVNAAAIFEDDGTPSDPIPVAFKVTAPWLNLSLASGSTQARVMVSLNDQVKTMAIGAYQALVNVSASDPVVNSPQSAFVNLTIKQKRGGKP